MDSGGNPIPFDRLLDKVNNVDKKMKFLEDILLDPVIDWLNYFSPMGPHLKVNNVDAQSAQRIAQYR